MNSVEIRKKLDHIKARYIGAGRNWHANDDSIIELLMKMYFQTPELDWEEIQWLFDNYVNTGILDFPKAKRRAKIRDSREAVNSLSIREIDEIEADKPYHWYFLTDGTENADICSVSLLFAKRKAVLVLGWNYDDIRERF